MGISESYLHFVEEMRGKLKKLQRDPASVKVLAVTKNRSIEEIQEAYRLGCRDFGENRVQEALQKIAVFPQTARWHLIGPVQRNKVKKIIGKFYLIHSVDRFEIAEAIALESEKSGIKTQVLLQVNTSQEPSKHGFHPDTVKTLIPKLVALNGIEIRGLMTMAPFVENEAHIRSSFQDLSRLRDVLQGIVGNTAFLSELSMGMSHDWKIAIDEGATWLRVGSLLFGERY